MTSPWSQIAKVEPVDLMDIMSEQFAHNLQAREDKIFGQQLAEQFIPAAATLGSSSSPSVSSAHLFAGHVGNTSTNRVETVDDDANVNVGASGSSSGAEAAAGPSSSSSQRIDSVMAADLLDNVKSASGFDLDDFCESDRIIAEMLQAQFDQDHDSELRLYEKHQNKNSKVSVSMREYRKVPENLQDEDEADDEPDEKQHWDRFVENEKILGGMSKKGFTYDKDGIRITKHDSNLNGVRNACRVMSFPPEIQTGDAAGFDMKLPNNVFNRLRTYSQKAKRSNKANDRRENVATAGMGLDAQTLLVLYKMVNNQMLEHVNGVVSTGKEAIILHADCDPSYEGDLCLPKEVAIKIFKTTLNEFKQRDRYIKDDYRFKDRFSKQNNRTVISMWAEKEMHNLLRMKSAGIRVPEVIALKKHMLIMTFLGDNMVAAPKLKDVRLSDANAIVAYEQTVEMMRTLYNVAKLVHADLSEYNILWHEECCWFIDVAQSVEPGHPSALEFMMRDCGNISTFFTRRGVPCVLSKEDLFRSITGLDPGEHTATMLERIHEKGASMSLATVSDLDEVPEFLKPRSYPFDYAWDKVNDAKDREDQAAPDKSSSDVLPAIG